LANLDKNADAYWPAAGHGRDGGAPVQPSARTSAVAQCIWRLRLLSLAFSGSTRMYPEATTKTISEGSAPILMADAASYARSTHRNKLSDDWPN